MNRFKNSKLLFWTVEILLLIIVFFFLYQLNFIFYPIKVIVLTLLPPVVTALFLYYLCNPIASRLGKLNVPKPLSVILIFVAFIALIVITVAGVIPGMVSQGTQLINSFPTIFDTASDHLGSILDGLDIEFFDFQSYFEELDMSIVTIVTTTMTGFFSGIGNIAGSLWSVGIVIVTAPIVLIYMFKDGHMVAEKVTNLVPRKHRNFFETITASIHRTLQAYIAGQAMICLYVGVSLFLVYTVAGLPYAFLLGILAGVMDIIPYAGPWIAAVPAIIVAFSISPITALIIAIAIIIIQLGESYIVSPYVMGKSLHLHPIVVIFVLLIAGQMAGLVGMIFGIPIFMIIKIIVEESIAYFKKEQIDEPVLNIEDN